MGEAAILAAAFAGTAAVAIHQGEQQKKAQEGAARQASSLAQQQAKQAKDAQARSLNESRAAEQEFNRANRRNPSGGPMASGNQASAAGGNASTMLTGPMGVDPSSLQLGRTTLLGG